MCHVSDGRFTECPDGQGEWGDITPRMFPATNAFLYVDQADLDPLIGRPGSALDTFMLMYDECGRRTPLGADEYFLVSLSTVEIENGAERFNLYTNHLFTDGTIIFIENGVPQHDATGATRVAEIEGQRGRVGFGPSPNCPFDHVTAEFQIKLSEAVPELHGGYSPDPQFWSSTPPCTVTITGGAATMNVGERPQFTATVSGASGPLSYQWRVDGDILKDYSESTNAPFSTTAMAPADFQQSTLAFYWKPDASQRDPSNGGPVARRVQVDITAGLSTCHSEQIISVERNNTNIDRQAEDFYTTNHNSFVLSEHDLWHNNFRFFDSSQGGALFFDFHHEYVARFNSWRSVFGYPAVGIWDPATPLPTGPDVDHANRPGTTNPAAHAKPPWFTIPGSAAIRPDNLMPCDTISSDGSSQSKLVEFPANRDLLGCTVESPWHNSVHVALGGDMKQMDTAPKDPIFWRWHNFVDVIAEERKTLTPPTVEYQSPFRLYRFVTRLPSVTVQFSEPVVGVRASDLTVNGSPATSVTGTGDGPYVFTGYAAPGIGPVTVTVLPGAITDLQSEAFGGRSWSQTIVDPAADTDGDGLTDGVEATVTLTDPTLADTDGDGLPDSYEVQHACLSANANESDPRDMQNNPLPRQDDPDHDGFTNLEEFQRGSDPCARTFVAGHHAMRSGFDASTLPGNDDGSTSRVQMGFTVNFFGAIFTGLFVNNNGNVTFDAPLGSFTPFNLSTAGRAIVAPFFGDVDTRGGSPVTYGRGTVDGHAAFGASWPGVGCFSNNNRVRNFFQVILIQRDDAGPGAFDIEFNYDQIQWETGQASGGNANCAGPSSARAGFSNGSNQPGTSFELPGSAVQGAFLDGNIETGLSTHRFNSGQPGRYVYAVRSGHPNTQRDTDSDTIADEIDNCPGTPNRDQLDGNFNGIGDACEAPGQLHDTAAFLQAVADGTVDIGVTDVAVRSEPTLVERLARIVEFRIAAALTTDPAQLAANLVQGLVDIGAVNPQDATTFLESVLHEVPQTVAIDILPFVDVNQINVTKKVTIEVAIASSSSFDAATVDDTTVHFGPGSAPAIPGSGHLEDVNADGRLDRVMLFRMRLSGIQCGLTTAALNGRTSSGQRFEGSDAVVLTGCP